MQVKAERRMLRTNFSIYLSAWKTYREFGPPDAATDARNKALATLKRLRELA